MTGTQLMLLGFVAVGVAIGAAIIGLAATEVTFLQRLVLGGIPIGVAVLIAWLAWADAPAPAAGPDAQ